MITIFDHIFSPLKDNDLDGALNRFARAGFIVDADKVRHRCGRLTGFVRLTGTYLELLSVVDEAEFNRDSVREDRLFRKDPQPYGIGAITENPEGIHRVLKTSYPEIRPPVSHGEVGDESGRVRWTLAMMPRKAFPGANLFAIQYHQKSGDPFRFHQGPNTIFAVGGFIFCSHRGTENKTKWGKTLGEIEASPENSGNALRHGGQEIEWISPGEYRRRFGREYHRMYEDLGAVAAVKLLCTDLATAQKYLLDEGFKLAAEEGSRAFFQPDANTGYAFELIQGEAEAFTLSYPRPVLAEQLV